MNIYITSTPEYTKDNIDSIVEVLKQVPGELEFKPSTPLSTDEVNLRFGNPLSHQPLHFEQLYAMGNLFRLGHRESVTNEDFVVVLTTYRNDQEWLSAFSEKNIFVDVNDWEYITESDSKYGIAYQIVENIFQSLSGININDVDNEPNIHKRPIGCINDMCDDIEDVKLKLRTAHICNSCLERAKANGVNPIYILQIISIVEKTRKGLDNIDTIVSQIVPPTLIINREGRITIGGKPIELEAIPKTLFIFYLKNLDGVRFEDLENRIDELYHIYSILKPTGEPSSVQNLCLPSANPSSTFLKVKSSLNKSLIRELGNKVSEFYVISTFDCDGHTIYKIKLEMNHRTIDPRF